MPGADGEDGLELRVVHSAAALGLTLCTAESLTAGLVCARIADVSGASAVLRGAVVAYATDLKSSELDVPPALLAEHGPVHADVATAMASGARRRLRCDLAVATTGVAGPGPHDGVPAGTVYVSVAWPTGARARLLRLTGGRAAVREAAADGALRLLADVLDSL